MKPVKVLIGPSSFSQADKTPIQQLYAEGFEVIENPFNRKLTKPELLALLPEVQGLIAGLETIDEEVLQQSQLKIISRCGAGLSNIDLISAKKLGIGVYSTPDGPTEAVAEITLGALLTLLRKIPQMDSSMHQGKWEKKMGQQLKGKTIAIIGFGRIGKRFAELLEPFHINLIVVDPQLTSSTVPYTSTKLHDALAQADIVSIHISGEECILNHPEFQLMKEGSILLNAARGNCLDEKSLIESITSGKIAAAWIDTFSEEPYSGVLAQFEQVLLTPHAGSQTKEGRLKMETEAVSNLIQALYHSP